MFFVLSSAILWNTDTYQLIVSKVYRLTYVMLYVSYGEISCASMYHVKDLRILSFWKFTILSITSALLVFKFHIRVDNILEHDVVKKTPYQERNILNADSNFIAFTAQIGANVAWGMLPWIVGNYLVPSGIVVSVEKTQLPQNLFVQIPTCERVSGH